MRKHLLWLTFAAPAALAAAEADRYPANGGEIVVTPVTQASFVLQTPGMVVYNDPVGGKAAYAGLPAPGLVLVCHEHEDHLDVDTLREVVGPDTTLVVNPASFEKLPAALKARARTLRNGEAMQLGPMRIEALPAYHTVPAYTGYHPRGRDNGYLLSVAGRRIYISGDTDTTAEVRALKDIDIAFLAISRWTMSAPRGVEAVKAIGPRVAYPYHYESVRERDAFAEGVRAAGAPTRVMLRDWR
ncbi:MBL fold metallo-hydrolase [Massilia sp. CFBP9012]|uniref:MBL fold metallo-hydrolase n=1 Tax=Massilia sp. CFBP9012 TaxID=3096531 RepID=UPI002A6A2FD7|nr:MBL fold metallo-hydrolase [Massilia sp. CFBP9012]MDY0974658.1 MBL fold metallo-hydrolase [Massilia sp. CFBP9012]